jgi:hypothetical protein
MFLASTIKAKGYVATTRPDGKLTVKGRGLRQVLTPEQFALLLNPPKREAVAK